MLDKNNFLIISLALLIFLVFKATEVTQTSSSTIRQNNLNNLEKLVKLVKLGSATKKIFTFPLVSVDLYINEQNNADDILKDIPKRIEVNYHWKIPKQQLDDATYKGISKNVTEKELQELLPRIKTMSSYFRDVGAGDQIAVEYSPGVGSRIELNKELKGIIPGEDFARAFFAIWVGAQPVDWQAKNELLGQK